ncbi:MAG: CaiB/BaiF CoA-transferase family protein [Betaproteobacteria bacterium]
MVTNSPTSTPNDLRDAPLNGIRVLDLSRVLAGPLCTQYMGDMGAEVIKIENLGHGDDMRVWPPIRNSPENDVAVGSPFLSVNRNKRSIALDIKSNDGQAILQQLISTVDVVIESFGPGVAERLGVDALTLRKKHPRLICCSVSGFGKVGSASNNKGYDVILQAFCGMISVTGSSDAPPVRAPYSPVDQGTGLHALIGILAALLSRTQTGEGSAVEVSLFDTATGLMGYMLQNFWERGTLPSRFGVGHEALCPYEAFDASDKPFMLGIANDNLWQVFCKLAGLEAIVDDPMFATNTKRVLNRSETLDHVKKAILRKTRSEWLGCLDAAGIPCSPIHDFQEFSEHPHMRESGMLYDYIHPVLGQLNSIAQPIKINGKRGKQRLPVPLHGEHTDEILLEIGLSSEKIKNLKSKGIINSSPEKK